MSGWTFLIVAGGILGIFLAIEIIMIGPRIHSILKILQKWEEERKKGE